MDLGSLKCIRTAFDNLDEKRQGAVDRQKAKTILRAAGWVLTDEELERHLDQSLRERGPAAAGPGKKGPGKKSTKETFTFAQLVDLLTKMRETTQNSGLAELQVAISRLSRNTSTMS